jgi:hypothetical protein
MSVYYKRRFHGSRITTFITPAEGASFTALFHKWGKIWVTLSQTHVYNPSTDHVHSMQCHGTIHSTLQVISSHVRSANGPQAGNTGSDSHTTELFRRSRQCSMGALVFRIQARGGGGVNRGGNTDEGVFSEATDRWMAALRAVCYYEGTVTASLITESAGISSRGILNVSTDIHLNFLTFEIYSW